MGLYVNGSLVGMGNAVKDAEYQKNLNERTTSILGDKTSISLADLKKTPVFSKIYTQLDKTGQEKLNRILSLDGDNKNVSEKELKTLLTLLDADLQKVDEYPYNGKEAFLMNEEVDVKPSNGIYQATEEEVQNVYQNTKTRAEMQADEIKKQKEMSQQLTYLNELVSEYDISNPSDLTKALNTLRQNCSVGNAEGMQIYESATSALFKGQLKEVQTYRDGGSRMYILKDGTEIYHDNKAGGSTKGYVTIINTDGSIIKYNREGEKIFEDYSDVQK